MLFTVVIATYNRSGIFTDSVNSVLVQEHGDYEILIIDDGSTDETREKSEALCLQHPGKIRYIWQENQERAAARNTGIANAKGEYILILDSDDKLLPNCLQILKGCILRFPDANFLTTYFEYLEDGRSSSSDISVFPEGFYGMESLLWGNYVGSFVCFKRLNPALCLYKESREFSTMEDWIFLLENLITDQLYILQTVTRQLIQHSGRSMNANQDVILKRLRASEYLLGSLPLNESQKNRLEAGTLHFCAIHSYLDNNKIQAQEFLKKERALSGLNKSIIVLYLKVQLGRSFIRAIKHFFNGR
jgi:glycosyltransferase involved in cell wall biosynthesis